jgi:hypothetical protein
MSGLDVTRAASAQVFSRELETRLQEQPENEEAILWVVNTDYGQTLRMVGNEDPVFWKAGTVIHFEWMQWMCIRDGDGLHWVDIHGEIITHEKMMKRASVVWPEDRRIISWLEDC